MKRITIMLLAAIFMLSSAVASQAESNIDVKVKGQWDFVFGWAENTQHFKNSGREDDNGIAAQRVRTQINFIASENLQGVLQFEIGDIHWGQGKGGLGRGSGGSRGTDGVNIETKHAYLDWMVPSTDLHIRMGLQALALPMATGLGSPIFDDDVAGIVANYKFDETFSLTAFWMRPYNNYINDDEYDDTETDLYGNSKALDDEVDAFGLIAPISLDGLTITPWGVWANIGDASDFYRETFGLGEKTLRGEENSRTTAWWAGLGIAVDMFDPLTFAVDAMYGHMQSADLYYTANTTDPYTYTSIDVGAEGWFIVANLNYKLDWGTPGLFAWYSTGDDFDDVEDDGKLGRIPSFATSNGFAPTSFGFDGGWAINTCDVLGITGTGTWGVGIQLADLSFIEDLSHTIRFAYIQGTNDAKIVRDGSAIIDDIHRVISYAGDFYLTDEDQAFEINFDHKYQIYENLAAVLELGYINLDLDGNTWADNKTDDAWKAQLAFQYKF